MLGEDCFKYNNMFTTSCALSFMPQFDLGAVMIVLILTVSLYVWEDNIESAVLLNRHGEWVCTTDRRR